MTQLTHDVPALLQQMASELRTQLPDDVLKQACMVGIHSGGVWVATELHRLLALEAPLGTLDISFYRDDFSRIGMHPQVRPSELPFELEERTIILVDDVLHSGRTVRAAMNELFDYGRPARILLAVLVERGGRELPIQADVCGLSLQLTPAQQVKLSGPEQMSLQIQEVA